VLTYTVCDLQTCKFKIYDNVTSKPLRSIRFRDVQSGGAGDDSEDLGERFLRNFVLPTTIHLSDGELAGLESYQLDEPETLRFGFRFSPEQNGLRDCSLS
jgi:hypothetical protein